MEKEIKDIIDEGLSRGGNWCDIFFEETTLFNLLLRDGIVGSGGLQSDSGCGIRVLSGEKTGYAYSESTDRTSLLSAARAAAAIADGSSRANNNGSAINSGATRIKPSGTYYTQVSPWKDISPDRFVPFLKSIESSIRRREPRTLKVIAMLAWSVSDIRMYNSLGESCTDSRPLGSVTVTAIFSQNGKVEESRVSKSFSCGAEMLTDSLVEEIAGMATNDLDAHFDARRPKGGKMPVVMGAGASGILLHEAMGHAFEADFNRKGQSIFADKMGKRIAPKGINIVDDGTISANRGAITWDDEGVRGQKTYMVTDGVLTSFLHDRISASYYGVEPTGNGRRESFRYNPIPRMRATYMENGCDGSAESIISSVRKGIFVDQFANGEVKIGEGDFTFYVKSGYLIENGRLTMPVKDINIIGNGPEVLTDIKAVASDLKIDNGNWTCGKEQNIPVSCGIPTVLVGKLTVGGE